MRKSVAFGALALTALIAVGVSADGPLKSGLQVGSSPTPFHPLHITGESAGEKACLV